ncbi:MAG: NAD(+) synthase [Candidatus Nanoarchaeia archaeon]
MVKFALAQMKVVPGKPDINVENMLKFIENAKKEKVDVIAFPEMCIGGYLLGDKWLSEEYCLDLMDYNETIKNASEGITIIYGNVYLDNNESIVKRSKKKSIHPNKDGRVRKYNAVYIYKDKKEVLRNIKNNILPQGIDIKTLHPNYRIFDDERYFFSLQDVAKDLNVELKELCTPFEIEINNKKIKLGLEICEDLWCQDYRLNSQAINKSKFLIENGAEYIINISASPWTFGKNNARDRRVEFLKQDSKYFVPFFYVNCTGVQNNGKNIVTFDGGSTIYNKEAKPIMLSKCAYEEELIIIQDKELDKKPEKRIEKDKIHQKYEALIHGISSIKDMIGLKEYPKVVMGLSGGIDSSVVAALLVKAIGKENVIGVNLPTKYNSQKTKDAAKFLAQALGIKYEIIPIENLVNENIKLLENADIYKDNQKLSTLNIENIQAKIRGTSILSNLSAKYNGIFTNNGNKDEVFLGYATLYGDVGGAFSPIGDLTKIEVVELAKFLNKEIFKKEIIPSTLIPDKLWNFNKDQIQPSAELKEKQIDPMKFIYHCALVDMFTDYKKITPVQIMQWYLEGSLHNHIDLYLKDIYSEEIGLKLMQRWNLFDPKEFVNDLEWFSDQLDKNVFKRIQSPPIIITSKSSFGYDIRESILPVHRSKTYNELKEKILQLKQYSPKNETSI